MSAPVRLVNGGGDPLEGELLRAALREAATDESRARVARALGLPPVAAASPGAHRPPPSGGHAASVAAPVANSAGQLVGLRLGTLAKYSLLGVFSGLVMFAGNAAWQARQARDGAAPLAMSPREPALPLAPVPDADPSGVLQPAASPESGSGRAAPREPPRPRMIPRAVRATAPAEDRLLAEVRQLDRARSALRSGERARALQLLDEHAAVFPHGELAREAAQLRVRAEQSGSPAIVGSQGSRHDIGTAR